MRHAHSFLLPADMVTLALAAVLLCLVAAIFWRWWQNSRVTPEERERRRRDRLARGGKMGDANLIDMRDGYLFYSYDVRGVGYAACQDVRPLQNLLPPDLSLTVGHALVKYDPRNPANSVILSEHWSGLRAAASQR
jgi:hypothetical protein